MARATEATASRKPSCKRRSVHASSLEHDNDGVEIALHPPHQHAHDAQPVMDEVTISRPPSTSAPRSVGAEEVDEVLTRNSTARPTQKACESSSLERVAAHKTSALEQERTSPRRSWCGAVVAPPAEES